MFENLSHLVIAFPESNRRNSEERRRSRFFHGTGPDNPAQELYSATLSSWKTETCGRIVIPMERTGIKTNRKDPEIAVDEALSMNDD